MGRKFLRREDLKKKRKRSKAEGRGGLTAAPTGGSGGGGGVGQCAGRMSGGSTSKRKRKGYEKHGEKGKECKKVDRRGASDGGSPKTLAGEGPHCSRSNIRRQGIKWA